MTRLYTLDLGGTPINDLKVGLTAQGLITTIFYETTGMLIFSTPLTSKVIRIVISGNQGFYLNWGDAYISEGDITNPQAVVNRDSGDGLFAYLFASADFFLLIREAANINLGAYVGALSDGTELIFGLNLGAGIDWFYNGCKAWDVTNERVIYPVGLTTYVTAKDAAGKLMKMPLLWAYPAGKSLYMDGASPANTVGVNLTSYKAPGVFSFLGTSYYLTSSSMYLAIAVQVLSTSLLIEFTPEA